MGDRCFCTLYTVPRALPSLINKYWSDIQHNPEQAELWGSSFPSIIAYYSDRNYAERPDLSPSIPYIMVHSAGDTYPSGFKLHTSDDLEDEITTSDDTPILRCPSPHQISDVSEMGAFTRFSDLFLRTVLAISAECQSP